MSPVHGSQSTQRRAGYIPYLCVMPDATGVPAFADLIANARKAKGWSQEELETASGVSRSTLSRWERGLADRPEPEHVRAVCAALGIDPRQAAVSLGLLTVDEIQPSRPLPPELDQVIDIIENREVPADDLRRWLDYLVFLKTQAQSRTRH